MAAEFALDAVERELVGTRFAGEVKHFALVGSTNQMALEAAAAGARGGVWVADEQTAGRGRGGHGWHSAAGDGLYVSALVTPGVALGEAPKITLATGLAVQAAILAVTGLRVDLRWPNDLMFGERKCGGILVESLAEQTKLRYAVVGIGINLNHQGFPEALRSVATSLYLENERMVEREALLASLLVALDRELLWLDDDARRGHLLERFAAASTWVNGKRVRVGEEGGYTGWTCGLDAQGFLQVRDDEGAVRTVLSGGVRPA